MPSVSRNAIPETEAGLQRWLGEVRSRSAHLAPSESRVIELVLRDPLLVGASTTAHVASLAGVSAPSVVRAARAIGYDGFAALKVEIARARGTSEFFAPPAALSEGTPPAGVLAAMATSGRAALTALEGAVDPSTIAAAVASLSAATQVHAFGAGPSATVAADAVFRFRALGCRTSGPQDHESAMISARLMTAEDVLMVVSSTGRTTSTLAVADAAAGAGATVIAITNQRGTPVTAAADIAIVVGGASLEAQMAASGSRLAHLVVIDTIAAAMVLADPARRRAAEYAGIDLPDIR